MTFNITRMTVYALVCALEEDLKSLLKSHLRGQTLYEHTIDQNLIVRAKSRLEKDLNLAFSDLELEDLIDYFDLGDTYQTINANSDLFPKHISKTIKAFTSDFAAIIPIRNRVMHVRPLNYDDLSKILNLCDTLLKNDPTIWINLKETTRKLKDDPSFVLSIEPKNLIDDSTISHNLPLPDFDETGLIGRDKIVSSIKNLCLGNFPVISIVGEGGVGKTAVALKVAYELLEERQHPFDAIVWVSSKTTQITVHEILAIKNSISDSLGIINEISNQIIGGVSFETDLAEINEYLATFKIALFIDNLETIIDDNIRNFVSTLPKGSIIIITSRIGLGAYEYPIKLQGIDESYAAQLLRALAKLRNVKSLLQLEEKIIRNYVNRMHRNPSYIKWFVSSVQTGISAEAVLQNSDLFLEFCMSNVYNYLSDDARKLTTTFQCAPGLKDLAELAYLTEFDSLRVQKAIQQLMATNMLAEDAKVNGASIKTTYQLSELSRNYLQKHHRPSQSFQKDIKQKRNKLTSIIEQQLSVQSKNNYSPKTIKLRDKNDGVIAKMLSDVLWCIHDNDYNNAYEILQEAQRLSPDYSEVARV